MKPYIEIDFNKTKSYFNNIIRSEISVIRNEKNLLDIYINIETDKVIFDEKYIRGFEKKYKRIINKEFDYVNFQFEFKDIDNTEKIFNKVLYVGKSYDIKQKKVILNRGWEIEIYENFIYIEFDKKRNILNLYWNGELDEDRVFTEKTDNFSIFSTLNLRKYTSINDFHNSTDDGLFKSHPIDGAFNRKISNNLNEIPTTIKKLKNSSLVTHEIVSVILKKNYERNNTNDLFSIFPKLINNGVKIINNTSIKGSVLSLDLEKNLYFQDFGIIDLIDLWKSVNYLLITILKNDINSLNNIKKYLKLIDNALSISLLPFKLIKETHKLKSDTIDLSDCGLTTLPYQLFELEYVENLILGYHFLCFNDLEKFRTNYSKNLFISNTIPLLPKELSKMKSLKSIVYDTKSVQYDNTFNSNPIENLKYLTGLERLIVHSDKVKYLTPLQNLVNLKFLDVSECDIDEYSLSQIKNSNIEDLEVNGTKITTFKWVTNFNNLKRLYATFYLKSFTVYESISEFVSLKKIETLIAPINDVKILTQLKSLKTVYLEGDEILNAELLNDLPNLTHFGIASKSIKDFNFLRRLTELEVLDLDDAEIDNLDVLSELIKLKVLRINNTNISTLEPLKNLSNLEIIHFSNTKIESLEPLRNCSKLKAISGGGSESKIRDLAPIEKQIRNSLMLENIKYGNEVYVSVNRSILNDESKAFMAFLETQQRLGWD